VCYTLTLERSANGHLTNGHFTWVQLPQSGALKVKSTGYEEGQSEATGGLWKIGGRHVDRELGPPP